MDAEQKTFNGFELHKSYNGGENYQRNNYMPRALIVEKNKSTNDRILSNNDNIMSNQKSVVSTHQDR